MNESRGDAEEEDRKDGRDRDGREGSQEEAVVEGVDEDEGGSTVSSFSSLPELRVCAGLSSFSSSLLSEVDEKGCFAQLSQSDIAFNQSGSWLSARWHAHPFQH